MQQIRAADYKEQFVGNFSEIHIEEASNVDKIIYVVEINNSSAWKLIYYAMSKLPK